MEERLEKEIEEVLKIALENRQELKTQAKKINKNIAGIKENRFALSILRDYKRAAKMWFIAFIVMTILFTIVCIHHFFF